MPTTILARAGSAEAAPEPVGALAAGALLELPVPLEQATSANVSANPTMAARAPLLVMFLRDLIGLLET
jgi:hypothetical protein